MNHQNATEKKTDTGGVRGDKNLPRLLKGGRDCCQSAAGAASGAAGGGETTVPPECGEGPVHHGTGVANGRAGAIFSHE